MNGFLLKNGQLYAEAVPLSEIAERYGTPCYVYSRAVLESAFNEFKQALADVDSLICYAIKANSNIAILDAFARLGAGFDIVSAGELKRALAAGADPHKVVFSGVGKTAEEMVFALNQGIFCFNVESIPELDRLNAVAGSLSKKAPVSVRVNPNVDAKTHPYISTGLRENKFGVAYDDALNLYLSATAMPHIEIAGIDCHIGSQILDVSPFAAALGRLLALADQLTNKGIGLYHINLGGGLGIRYKDEEAPTVKNYLQPLLNALEGRGLKVILEPGRRLVGNAGLLLTKIEYLKKGEIKNFAVVDAAMNDLARPALYGAWHDILPVVPRDENRAERTMLWDVVGPVCESSDFLGHQRMLKVQSGDLLAVMSAGAYGMSMSSNYNSRPRIAEVMVDGDKMHLIRRRETIEEIYALESRLP